MSNNKEDYHAYMLRVWRDSEGQAWRATVENPHSGEMTHFATMFELYLFLNGLITDVKEKPYFGLNRTNVDI
ncbi:MAG: hypothetical protein AAF490_25640 [Chloroflexota bacterium]